MKKALSILLALGMTVGCISGTGVTAAAAEADAAGDYVIGVLAPEVTHGWVARCV